MKKLIVIIITALLGLSLVGCGGFTDYVAKVKLTESYEGKNFLTNGIGEVTLAHGIDGDTAHFYQSGSSTLIKVRFLGVDTPESTGKIEPYGKAASEYTTTALENAKTIVLSSASTDGSPEIDSTGSRYLAWVWVDGKLLNLMLAQDGYSNAKVVSGSPYSDYLVDADLQAQKHKLGMWCGLDDPDFYDGESQIVSLRELREDTSKYLGTRVLVQGIVSRAPQLNAYIQDMDEDNGLMYGVYIFSGYNSSAASLFKIGNMLQVTGIVSEYNGAAQLTDVKYNKYFPTEDDMTVISTDNEVIAQEVTVSDLIPTNKNYEHTLVKVTGLKVTGGYNENSGSMTINAVDANGNTINLRIDSGDFIKAPNGETIDSYSYFVDITAGENQTIDVTGIISVYNGAFQICIVSGSDINYNN